MTRKNIVVVMMDDCPPDALDKMPYLTGKAAGSWVDFPQAIVAQPICGPSRATIFTGRYASTHGVERNDDADSVIDFGIDPSVLLAPALARTGYATGCFGKYQNRWPWVAQGGTSADIPPGWSRWSSFLTSSGYYNYTLVEDGVEVAYGSTEADYSTDVLFGQAAGWIAEQTGPFFCYIPVFAPHYNAGVAARHATLYDGETPARRPNFNEADISDKPTYMAEDFPTVLDSTAIATMDAEHLNAWRALKAVDEGIEDVVDALTAAGTLANTAIFVLTDNSDLFGEHRISVQKAKIYEEAINAGLYVRWPGVTNSTSQALVSTVDLAPTWLDIARGRLPVAPQGQSLVPLLDGTNSNLREWAYVEDPSSIPQRRFWCMRSATEKYAVRLNGDIVYYDLTNDPYELVNDPASAPSAHSARLRKLKIEYSVENL
jgi:N-acetylglucosamine-6-sulfatase